MASLTLKGIPDAVMEALRRLAEQERRSLNQQAILLLEQSLRQRRPGFTETYSTFLRDEGPSPLDDEVFDTLRSPDKGRRVKL